MKDRYQLVKAVIFKNGVIIPFWKCEYEYTEYYGERFKYNDEESGNTHEALWDCKKQDFVSFFIIDIEKKYIPVGTKVVFECDIQKYSIETIKEVKYEKFEDYFEKYKDCKERVFKYCLENNIELPENTKTVIWRNWEPSYYFESGKSTDFSFMVKELECT